MKPSIGRIVHYTSLGDQGWPSEIQAAIITRVNKDPITRAEGETVALHIFYPTGEFYLQEVELY